MKTKSLKLDASGTDLSSQDPNFLKCERFASNVDDIVLNWFYSYEGYLAHHEKDLKANKSNPMLHIVPPVLILAHEFFDALPVMIFEKTENGWVEKLVDNNVDMGAM